MIEQYRLWSRPQTVVSYDKKSQMCEKTNQRIAKITYCWRVRSLHEQTVLSRFNSITHNKIIELSVKHLFVQCLHF